MRNLWRRRQAGGYVENITHAPRRSDELDPVRRPAELDQYVGKWVALKDGRVVADAVTSSQLVDRVRELGEAGVDAVAEFVAPPSQTWMVGVG